MRSKGRGKGSQEGSWRRKRNQSGEMTVKRDHEVSYRNDKVHISNVLFFSLDELIDGFLTLNLTLSQSFESIR
jgi:hypothetical protein